MKIKKAGGVKKLNVFWFRRDLRLEDNAGLYHALRSEIPVIPLFIFDKNILGHLSSKKDARVEFIHLSLKEMNDKLHQLGSSLLVLHGKPPGVWKKLASEFRIEAVYANNDYEPYAIKRDSEIRELLNSRGIEFNCFKDHVVFEKDEVVKDDGSPYTVYTPYSRKWKSKLTEVPVRPFRTSAYFKNFFRNRHFKFPSLKELGFSPAGLKFPEKMLRKVTIQRYKEKRDLPGADGTTRTGLHLRFGTVSIRKLVEKALMLSETWLGELIWREFFMNIIYHFPHAADGPFRKEYEAIKWRNNEQEFRRWCAGKTGYAFVDAGMRELNETGFMHNRARMVTASFLTKHLLIDWRWGEAYFAGKLLDYELASNNGNWQWAAGTGCDAAPYFRIFNPDRQAAKFDPQNSYIRKWVPEFGTASYTPKIVEHNFARERALRAFREALQRRKTRTYN